MSEGYESIPNGYDQPLQTSDKPALVYVLAGNCIQGDRWAREMGFQKRVIRRVFNSSDLVVHPRNTLYVVGTAIRDRRDVMHTIDYAEAAGWRVVFESGEVYNGD